MIRIRYASAWTCACAGLILCCSSAAAQTCPCPKYDLPAIVEKADVILIGKVLSATEDSTGATQNKDGGWRGEAGYQMRVMLDVSTVLKGKPPRIVEVATPTGLCGFVFSVGKTYLVTGQVQGATVITDVCHANAMGDAIRRRAELIRDVLHPQQ
jgi:hypothetical protein